MIAEAVLDFVFGLVGFLVGLFPEGDAPGWMTDAAGQLNSVVAYASGLGAWLPFNLGGNVIMAILACVAIGFVIKVVRIIYSAFTGGGSSAA